MQCVGQDLASLIVGLKALSRPIIFFSFFSPHLAAKHGVNYWFISDNKKISRRLPPRTRPSSGEESAKSAVSNQFHHEFLLNYQNRGEFYRFSRLQLEICQSDAFDLMCWPQFMLNYTRHQLLMTTTMTLCALSQLSKITLQHLVIWRFFYHHFFFFSLNLKTEYHTILQIRIQLVKDSLTT